MSIIFLFFKLIKYKNINMYNKSSETWVVHQNAVKKKSLKSQ